MNEVIACCGLRCDTCAIYLATRETDDEKRRKMRDEIVKEIKKAYGRECRPEDVTDCDGCRTEGGRLFSGCENCQIRKCAKEKGVENCAHCGEYACEKLAEFFAMESHARARLDEIRGGL
jgi:hypothetical protein